VAVVKVIHLISDGEDGLIFTAAVSVIHGNIGTRSVPLGSTQLGAIQSYMAQLMAIIADRLIL
jgi:hypothetical protein